VLRRPAAPGAAGGVRDPAVLADGPGGDGAPVRHGGAGEVPGPGEGRAGAGAADGGGPRPARLDAPAGGPGGGAGRRERGAAGAGGRTAGGDGGDAAGLRAPRVRHAPRACGGRGGGLSGSLTKTTPASAGDPGRGGDEKETAHTSGWIPLRRDPGSPRARG